MSNNKAGDKQQQAKSFLLRQRILPADTILLENGSTTFVSTLDEYLASSSSSPSSTDDDFEKSTFSSGSSSITYTPKVVIINQNDSRSTHTEHSIEFTQPELEPKHNKLVVNGSVNATNLSPPPTSTKHQTTANSSGSASLSSLSSTTAISNAESKLHANAGSLSTLAPIQHAAEATAAASSTSLEGENNQHHHSAHHSPANTNNNTAPKPIPQHWQVKSLLNVTYDYPLAYSQIICGYIWPLMAAITLFTNLMIVFVLTQRDMRTPTNVVLTAIAIADIIPIVVPVPWFIYLFAMGNEKQVLYPPIVCYFYQHSTRSVSEVFYFLSTWLNVLLAVQDYLAACWPKLAKKYCQIKVVVIEIISLTLLAFLLNLPQALKLVFKPIKFFYEGKLTFGCKALQARWFKDLIGEYVALYDDIFTAIIVLFVDGGPAIALIVLTALLIRQLQRQRIQGHLLMERARTASKRRRERNRQQEYESSARVMIFVLLAFLAVKIPFATTYTLMIIQSRFEIHFVKSLTDFQKAVSVIDLVFVLSYPLNFTIFCCCSKKFRHKCAQLLGECNNNTRDAKIRLMSRLSRDSFKSDNTSIGSSKKIPIVMTTATNDLEPTMTNQQHDDLYQLDEDLNGNLISVRRHSNRSCDGGGSGGGVSNLSGYVDVVASGRSDEKLDHERHYYDESQTTQPDYDDEMAEEESDDEYDDVGGGGGECGSSSTGQKHTARPRLRKHSQQQVMSDESGLSERRSGRRELRPPPPVFGALQRCGASSSRGCSDPGGSKFPRQLKIFVRSSEAGIDSSGEAGSTGFGGHDGRQGRSQHDLGLMRIEEKHRSLSMSNSKLSALPSATCLLADVLKTTLLAPPSTPSTQSRHKRTNR